MKHTLFVANLPDTITEDRLREVCVAHGEVSSLSLTSDETTGAFTGTAWVTLDTEEPLVSLLAPLNTHWFGEQRMIVSSERRPGSWKKLTDEQRTVVEEIAEVLGETTSGPKHQIGLLLQACGEVFIRQLLQDTLKVEEAGGLWLATQNRRRTTGGVFLYLARQWVSPQLREAIFVYRKKKSKGKPPAPPAEKPQAAVEATRHAEPPAQVEEPPEPQFVALQRAYQEAQDRLAAIKSGKASGSPMTAMKAVMDTKRALDEFRRAHPGVG